MKQFQENDLVKVKTLEQTILKIGINDEMKTMIGKDYSVTSAGETRTNLRSHSGEIWIFDSDDLEIVQKAADIMSEAMPEKQMFDPNELNL